MTRSGADRPVSAEAFARALLSPEIEVPAGLVDPLGRAAPRRFAVYRNNVVASLTRALEEGFPVTRKLVGEAFFAAMAGVYLRASPPRSPLLMLYGLDFPDFIAGFPPAETLGYLPDVARLEYALRESYHAADAPAVAPDALAQAAGGDLLAMRLRLAPAMRLVRSKWPVLSIWAANARGGAAPRMQAEAALILRPEFDPEPYPITPEGAAFVAALSEGLPIGAALEAAPGADAGAILGLLLSNHSITEVLP